MLQLQYSRNWYDSPTNESIKQEENNTSHPQELPNPL